MSNRRPLRFLWLLLSRVAVVGAAVAALLAFLSRSRRQRRQGPSGEAAGATSPPPPSEPLGLLGGITHLSLRKRTIVFLAAGLVALAGIFAATQINQELFPDIDFPAITVVTRFPGASPDAVSEEISEPIEGAISNVQGLERLQSTSADGISIIEAEFDYGTDLEKREEEIANSVSNLSFTAGVGDPVVNRIDLADFPILAFTMYGERSQAEIDALAEDVVVPALERIDGVFSVTTTGASENRLVVSLDPARMASSAVTADDVEKTLEENNLSTPSGFAVENGKILPVRTEHQLISTEDVADLALVSAAPADGPALRISDVADVGLEPSPLAAIARTNGQPSLAIGVFKAQDANTVEVANEVANTLDRLEREGLLKDVRTTIMFDQSDMIEESIDALLQEGLLGAIFAVLVILFFLTSVRATLVTAVSIPLSLLAAIAVLNWQGVTLNVMTLGGLTVAVGRVVDDSIVVLENIYVHSRRGKPLFQAAVDGPREVSTAILSSTLVAIAVFLPLALMGGLVGEFYVPFALAVAFALLASFVVAMTVVPALSVVLIPVLKAQDGDTWLQRLYTPILRWCLGHRAMTLVGAGALFAASFALLPFINFSFLATDQENVLLGRLELPSGTHLAATNEVAERIEDRLATIDTLETSQLIIGRVDPSTPGAMRGGVPGTNTIDFVLAYDDGVDIEAEAESMRKLASAFPGVQANVEILGPHFESDLVEIVVSGSDYEGVAATTKLLTEALGTIPELENLDNNIAESQPELLVLVDPAKASSYQLTAEEVSQEVRELLVGRNLGTVRIDGEPADLVVRVGSQPAVPMERVGQLVLGGLGGPRLEEIAEVDIAQGPATVTRVDQQRAATITANITGSDVGGVSGRVDDVMSDVEREPGVDVRIGGIFEQQEEAFTGLYYAMGIAVIVVYIVMVASLGSLVNPFIILFSLPFISVGAFFALFVTDRDIGLSALIGLLMLIGIVVTNAIVLITFVEMLKGRGLSTREALLQGGRSRVRPILMTAFATIFALIPLSLGLSRGGMIIAEELATVVIGGLFTSTMLTLVVIPVIYSLFSDLGQRLRART
jgi:HAE1 family hydrophobic/amphiphilic exporter-1